MPPRSQPADHESNFPAAAPARQRIQTPVFRKLRVFALDPGLTARFETAVVNEATLDIPWEKL